MTILFVEYCVEYLIQFINHNILLSDELRIRCVVWLVQTQKLRTPSSLAIPTLN